MTTTTTTQSNDKPLHCICIYYNDELDLKILVDRALVETRNNQQLVLVKDRNVKSSHYAFKYKVVYKTNISEEFFKEIIKERILDIKAFQFEAISTNAAKLLKSFFSSKGIEIDPFDKL